MKKEIKISFIASVDDKDIVHVKRDFSRFGKDIMAHNFPELSNVSDFAVEEKK